MRAALGLALLVSGGALALLVLQGRTPFAGATSPAGGRAPTSGVSGAIQNPNATQQQQHTGGF